MKLRIHGDNILEYEHTLHIIAAAFGDALPVVPRLVDGPLWAPNYVLPKSGEAMEVQLFSGYGRWTFDIQDELRRRGAPLREMVDDQPEFLYQHE